MNARRRCRLAGTAFSHHQHGNVVLRQLAIHAFERAPAGADAVEPNPSDAVLRRSSSCQDFRGFEVHAFRFVPQPRSGETKSMDYETTEILATAGAPQNGVARVWLESVSAGMRTVEAVIRELSQNDVPMLVVAERGSGKVAAAARIHALCVRASEPVHPYT